MAAIKTLLCAGFGGLFCAMLAESPEGTSAPVVGEGGTGAVNFGSAVTAAGPAVWGGEPGERVAAAGMSAPRPRPSRDIGGCFFGVDFPSELEPPPSEPAGLRAGPAKEPVCVVMASVPL